MKEKRDCKIVQDLLPNYIENLTNEETNRFIEEHLKECPECQKVLENMKKELKDSINNLNSFDIYIRKDKSNSLTFNQVDIDYSSKVEKYKELLDSYNFILDKIKLILKNLDILEKKDISYIDSVKSEFEKLVKKYIVNKKKIEDEIIKINSINDIIREQEDIIQNIKTDEDKKFEVYKNAKNKLIDCIAGLIKLQDKIKEYTPNIDKKELDISENV